MQVPFKISMLMFILWGMLAMITLTLEMETDPDQVGGSAAGFQDLANAAANPDQVNIDQATIGGSTNPIASTWNFAKQAAGWVSFIARSLMLQSDIWEPWAQPIRYGIMLLSIPYMLHITGAFASSATNFLGGIFGRVGP